MEEVKEYIVNVYETPYRVEFFMTMKIYAFDKGQAERRISELCNRTDKRWANLEEVGVLDKSNRFFDDIYEELKKEQSEWETIIPF